MRRPSPEWLLAPVFALPFVAAAGLALWARHDYFARIEPYRKDGETLARRWLQRDPARVAWLASTVAEDLPAARAGADGWIPFAHPQATGFVRVSSAPAPQPEWRVAPEFAAGLKPSALADAGVRLAVETGSPPGRRDDVDAGTAAFCSLVEAPSLARLREAPLPASTKLYLLRRAAPPGPAGPHEEMLTALAAFERRLPARGGRLVPGAHAADGVRALVALDGTTLLYPRTENMPCRGFLVSDFHDDPDVRIVWTPAQYTDADAWHADIAWKGRLDDLFAGEWAFVLPHGEDWWKSETLADWIVPVAFGCLAFLFIPTSLLIALRRRRKLDEARARFVNELAHDLRTPVTSLRLHAEMLAQGRVPAGGEARYLDVLSRETARLSSLLANLLDLSRVERGARDYEVQALDVGEMLRDAVRDFASIHPKRAADVTLDAADGLAAKADRTALARCLANLLDNAGKFSEPGTPIRVTASRAGARTRIGVADDGPGVAAAERSRVFELYERGLASKNGAPGTGLGLALVRELVQGMGGRVTLLETPRGAAFEIDLPEATS